MPRTAARPDVWRSRWKRSCETGVRDLHPNRACPGAQQRSPLASFERSNGSAALVARGRPLTRGKFLWRGEEKLYLRGVTYGTFEPRGDGIAFPDPATVARDFALMAQSGVNTVRTYTVPPHWLLDLAAEQGLLLLIGLPWEEHIAFLESRDRARSIEQRVREGVRGCAEHPAVLGYAIGNEIAAPIVRWHGRRRVERFLDRLYRAAKEEDCGALVTYVNYPSTEYLQLPFLDFVSFNVYLEREDLLDAYLARLQNLAGERPLVLGEIGYDSRRHGELGQAAVLDWQVRTAFRAGCAGAFVFAWTDEWYRGGHDVDDWDFGLTDRARRPKRALASVREAFRDVPPAADDGWPLVSVVVCSHNGARTLRKCLEGIAALDYPRYETIVVDDGSTDGTWTIAAEFPVRLIRTENRGLSAARNTGVAAAGGEIVAYVDDDAWPDPHWLVYLVAGFRATSHAGIGGPNLVPTDAGGLEACVARAPGGPVHVLVSDREAEHIPGCNMAFRKRALLSIGGFDSQFRVAGDDVDVCWRLQEAGETLGFSPAALVWHRRRSSVRAYARQQYGYGAAEALLERKWPERYNRSGHLTWSGRVYGASAPSSKRWRIYYGTWGTGLFQSLYEDAPRTVASLPLMPEWYLLIGVLAALAGVEFGFAGSLLTLPGTGAPFTLVLLALAVVAVLGRALAEGWRAFRHDRGWDALRARLVTAALHVVQPLARLAGRIRRGLTPWRSRGKPVLAAPRGRSGATWSELWAAPAERLQLLDAELRSEGASVLHGGPFDRWDAQARTGMLGAARLRLAVEEHGRGRQLIRYRVWPRLSRGGSLAVAALALLAFIALHGGSALVAIVLASAALVVAVRMVREAAAAVVLALRALERQAAQPDERSDYVPKALEARLPRKTRAPHRIGAAR